MANGGCAYMKPLSQRECLDLWIINFMKIASYIAVAVFVVFLAGFSASGQNTNKSTFTVNFVNASADQFLDFYKSLTKSELLIGSHVLQSRGKITLQFRGSLEALTPLIEQALAKQAGIVITHLDGKRVSVTYNDEWEEPRAGSQAHFIILTSQDVKTNSVHLITTPAEGPNQDVLFKYADKTPAEIKAIANGQTTAKIMKDGVEVAETVQGGCAGYLDKHTNYVGLDLIFGNYDEAKLAANTLRGN